MDDKERTIASQTSRLATGDCLPMLPKIITGFAPSTPAVSSSSRNILALHTATHNGTAPTNTKSTNHQGVAEVQKQLINPVAAATVLQVPPVQAAMESPTAVRRPNYLIYAKAKQILQDIHDRGKEFTIISYKQLEKFFDVINDLQIQNRVLSAQVQKLRQQQAVVTLPAKSPSPPAKKFTLFRKLPLELRLMVWKLVLDSPRVITVEILIPRPVFKPRFTRPIMSIRAVCHEARGEALKVQRALNRVTPGETSVFINHAVDIVWVSGWGISDDEWMDILPTLRDSSLLQGRIRKIAIGVELWDRLLSSKTVRFKALDMLLKLGVEEVVIVIDKRAHFGTPNVVLVEPRHWPKTLLHPNFIDRIPIDRIPVLPRNPVWTDISMAIMVHVLLLKDLCDVIRKSMVRAGFQPDNPGYRGRYPDFAKKNRCIREICFMQPMKSAA